MGKLHEEEVSRLRLAWFGRTHGSTDQAKPPTAFSLAGRVANQRVLRSVVGAPALS